MVRRHKETTQLKQRAYNERERERKKKEEKIRMIEYKRFLKE